MSYYQKIVGERVYLSPIDLEDTDTYTQWINDFSTSVPLGNSHRQFSLHNERAFLESIVSKHHYAIIAKDTDELLGNCSIFDIHDIHKRAEVGIFIGDEKNRSKGYGTEALQLLCEYAYAILNLHNITLRVFSFNKRAITSYQKVGFRVFNVRHEAIILMNKFYDSIHMELLPTTFKFKYLDKQLNASFNLGGDDNETL